MPCLLLIAAQSMGVLIPIPWKFVTCSETCGKSCLITERNGVVSSNLFPSALGHETLISHQSHWQNWYPALHRCGEHQQCGVDLLLEKSRAPSGFCPSGSPSEGVQLVHERKAPFCWDYARNICRAGRELGDYLPQLRTVRTR
jgi:hypothetical protein